MLWLSWLQLEEMAMDYVIFSPRYGYCAVMEGTNVCQVRWGDDLRRVRRYATDHEALAALKLLTDADDRALGDGI